MDDTQPCCVASGQCLTLSGPLLNCTKDLLRILRGQKEVLCGCDKYWYKLFFSETAVRDWCAPGAEAGNREVKRKIHIDILTNTVSTVYIFHIFQWRLPCSREGLPLP